MDQQTPAAGSQRDQERHRATVGTKVPGLSHQPGREDRSRAPECRAIQNQSSGVMAKLPESDQQRAAGHLARLRPRLVGIFPSGRGTPEPLRIGGLDTATHSELLLAAVGQLAWTTAQAAELGPERTPAKGGAQFQGSVANCSQSKLADGAEQRGFAAPWILDAIRPCFPMKMEAAFNRRMRANRMSGGVGGCRGAIPGIRPDPSSSAIFTIPLNC